MGDAAADVTGRGIENDGRMDRESLLRYLSLRLDYETGIYEPALLLNQMTKGS